MHSTKLLLWRNRLRIRQRTVANRSSDSDSLYVWHWYVPHGTKFPRFSANFKWDPRSVLPFYLRVYTRTDVTRAGVFRMIESLRVLRSRDFIFLFLSLFFRLPRVRDHFRISPCIVRARTKRQTARDTRYGINIDLRILPWSITREMTLANAANYFRLPGETETWTVCYQIAEQRQRLLTFAFPAIWLRTIFFQCRKEISFYRAIFISMKMFTAGFKEKWQKLFSKKIYRSCYLNHLRSDLRHFSP